MDKFRTAMGILVGVILGFVYVLGFRSIAVGIFTAVCYSILFAFIFNKYRRKGTVKKLYFDNSTGDCVSIHVKDAEVIPAGVSIYSMPVSEKNEEYERYAQKYDIHFIFDDSVPEMDFYAVPRIDVFATDSEGGFICTIGGITDFQSESGICYIDKNRNVYLVAENGRKFLENVSEWKVNRKKTQLVKIYASQDEARKELEFISIDKLSSKECENS